MTLGRVVRLGEVLLGLLVGVEVVAGLEGGAGNEIPALLRRRNPGAAKPVTQKAISAITATRIPMATPGLMVEDGVFCWSGRPGRVIGFTFRADLNRRSDGAFGAWVPILSETLRIRVISSVTRKIVLQPGFVNLLRARPFANTPPRTGLGREWTFRRGVTDSDHGRHQIESRLSPDGASGAFRRGSS